MKRYPFDPPIDPKLNCRNCGDPIVAVAQISDDRLSIKGLRQYEWTHAHGSEVCRPKTTARPYDGWDATARVEAVLAERQEAEDALIEDEEAQR